MVIELSIMRRMGRIVMKNQDASAHRLRLVESILQINALVNYRIIIILPLAIA